MLQTLEKHWEGKPQIKGTKEEKKYMADPHRKENLNEEEYSHTWQRSQLNHQDMKES